jgi:Tol biopolymer transport system component
LHAERPQDGITNLDARGLVPPFTPGALQGGTHLHTFSPDGRAVLFTCDDHLAGEANRRNVGVAMPWGPIIVPKTHPRNHDGTFHCFLLTSTDHEIVRASEEGWLGTDRVVFQGQLPDGKKELYLVEARQGAAQRRLTHTQGLGGPRHWPRPSPDLTRVAFLMPDSFGVVQLWLADLSGRVRQLTNNAYPIESAFTWGATGIAHIYGGWVCLTDPDTGITRPLTKDGPSRPEACVLSPDGKMVAFVRPIDGVNQVFVVGVP